MRLRLAVAAGFFAFASHAGAAPPIITHPDWIVKPDAGAYSRYYPPLASELGVSGYAVIHCKVGRDGYLSECSVGMERPAALGFGQAAIGLSAEFQMRPQTLNGQPVDGAGINIPIRFNAPRNESAAEPPAPLSDAAAQQAYRLVDASKALDNNEASYEQHAKQMESMGADRAIARAAAEAYRRASLAHRDDFRSVYARAFASVFSETELASIADYQSVAGDQKEANETFTTVQFQIVKEYQRSVAALAHAAFCAKTACGSAADVQRVWQAADPRDTTRIDNPQWAAQPSATALAQAQPRLAGLLGLNGLVRLTCKVGEQGNLTDCSIDEESPIGLGYGAAALKVTDAFLLNPIQLGAGAAGRKATVRVGFPAAPPSESFHVKPGSTRAAALARQIGATDKVGETGRLETELQATDFATNPPKGSDPKVYDAAVDAYRTATRQALADYLQQSIDNLSTAYTEAQLQARADFAATPGGKAEQSRSKELALALAAAQAFVTYKIRDEAHAEFCKTRDCSIPPPAQPSTVNSAPSTPRP
ncbi:MAG TPA: TonB family protein [Phenylobacterium sp.]|jgi:TonB family protein|uniref:TonB family protein n=1 Tax=Phenylobacterium sp. TaxID=1871053 RepID=UPI002BC86425|nr:TonB family protein [Phenylobacterium sp.]HXA39940.1 TonB family protein [Phenylobacterium sp.]